MDEFLEHTREAHSTTPMILEVIRVPKDLILPVIFHTQRLCPLIRRCSVLSVSGSPPGTPAFPLRTCPAAPRPSLGLAYCRYGALYGCGPRPPVHPCPRLPAPRKVPAFCCR